VQVLALNCGSSSVKFALFEVASDAGERVEIVRGALDLATGPPMLRTTDEPRGIEFAGRAAGVEAVLEWLVERGHLAAGGPDVVAHRVVHGGVRFTKSTRVDDGVRRAIEQASRLAPLHNRAALDAIEVVTRRFPSVTQTASFDTAFHRSMPERASRYAVPAALAEEHGLLRYGFHGLAHRSMVRWATEQQRASGREAGRLITLQLGAGCSAAAVFDGRSIDTSMGLTPLEGLMMATRSGDVDPAFANMAARALETSTEEVERILNHESGLLGVSGHSADLRVVLEAGRGGDARSALAVEMFCYRLRKQIGAYLAALGGADAIVFGGGIGEHQPEVRRRALEGLAWAGIELEPAANEAASGGATISRGASRVAVLVASVDEETELALDAAAVMSSVRRG